MDEIFNFAKQQMSTYTDRFGAINPMQQDITWGCNGSCYGTCSAGCAASCAGSCKVSCTHGCQGGCVGTCYHACDFGGTGTKRRGW